ncbi:MAG: o-succinylbenzoate synthase [Anaerolineae bacterium]
MFSPHPYTLHFKRAAATSRGLLHARQVIFIRAAQDDRVGWGECGTVPGLSRDDRADYVEQVQQVCDQLNRGAAWHDLDLRSWPSIAFGLETARLDVARGGRGTLFDTPFARGEAGLVTHGLLWMDTPTRLVQQAATKVAQGHRVLKLKVGALPLAEEISLLRTLRERWPADRIELRLDANGAWAVEDARRALHAFAPFGVAWLEQPIAAGQVDALAALCAESPIPLALDEELIHADDPVALLAQVQPQHIVLKPALLGGLGACERWIAAATARGIGWWINSLLESNIGLNAIAQWLSALPDTRVHGMGTGQLFSNNVPPAFELRGEALWRVLS